MAGVFSATYSNVPVYECTINGNLCMRRRQDDYVNATHILKVAGYDKPQRTRILEREVQKGVHEKIQGGYGKYQGTWIPLADGKALAARSNVTPLLAPLLDFVAGDKSPPPAPKHAIAAGKLKAPRAVNGARKAQRAPANSQQSQASQPSFRTQISQQSQATDYESFTNGSERMDDMSVDGNTTITSITPEDEAVRQTGRMTQKRKRDQQQEMAVHEHIWYGDSLLDYFLLHNKPGGVASNTRPPVLPDDFDVNRAIDDDGNTALHWAAAMGDLDICRDLLFRGANVQEANGVNGCTALIHSVRYTNNFDKKSMQPLLALLQGSLEVVDWAGASVLHYIVHAIDPVSSSLHRTKLEAARYYTDAILSKAEEIFDPRDRQTLIDRQDHDGNTAITLAAKIGARKVYRALQKWGADPSIRNQEGVSAEEYKKQNIPPKHNIMRMDSSSPPKLPAQAASAPPHLTNGNSSLSFTSQTAQAAHSTMAPILQELVKELTDKWEEQFKELRKQQEDCDIGLREQERALADLQEEARVLEIESRKEVNSIDLAEEAEIRRLEIELREELESEQAAELGRTLQPQSPMDQEHRESSTGAMDDEVLMDDSEILAKSELAAELSELQQMLEEQTADVINRQAIANLSDGAAKYRDLISQCTGIGPNDLEGMYSEMLSSVETKC